MFLLNLFIIFIFGTIIGSFLNVVALRYNTGLSIVKGRSRCFSCGKDLSWYELIPLFSFLFLGGKCSSCKSKISYQYFIVELITGALFVGLFLKFGLSPILPLYLSIASILIVMAVYDFKHKIIPDAMVFVFILLSIIAFICNHQFIDIFSYSWFMDLFVVLILFSFFTFFWLISSGKWMGFGDAKLAIGIGFLLGFSGGIYAILLSFWIGAAYSLFIIFLQKIKLSNLKLSLKSEVPFAPFMILAVFIQIFTSWNLNSIIF